MANEAEAPADSWRAALSDAYDKASTPEPVAVAVDAPSAPTTPEPRQATEPAPEGPVRDEQGRFTAKEKPAAASNGTPPARASDAGAQGEAVKDAPGGPPAAVAAPAAPLAPVSELKAPQSWKPSAREAFAKAPPEVQAEALRREAEITRALNETAEPRKLKEAVAPYEHLFRGAGLSTPQAVGNVLQKYAQLQTAPPQVRAQIIGQLVRDYMGTDEAAINLLASALEGKPTQPGAIQQFGPEQIRSLVQEQLQQERSVAQQEQARSLAEQFKATEPEHLAAVQDDMIDNLMNWERRNPGAQATMETFQQAYKKACLTNETVSAIEERKKAARTAANAVASTQKAKAASSSVKSQPGGGVSGPTPPGDDIRSHLEASWDAQASR